MKKEGEFDSNIALDRSVKVMSYIPFWGRYLTETHIVDSGISFRRRVWLTGPRLTALPAGRKAFIGKLSF